MTDGGAEAGEGKVEFLFSGEARRGGREDREEEDMLVSVGRRRNV